MKSNVKEFGNKTSLFFKKVFKSEGFNSILTSIICILIGLLIGFIILLCIAPEGALKGIETIILNFFAYKKSSLQLKYFAKTLTYTAPLILCGVSVLFAYKTGLFNIGAAGQYTVGAGVAIISAIAWHCPWYVCLLLAMLAGAIWGSLVGLLKAFFGINEVISAIMLNWIGLYLVNMCIQQTSAWDTVKYETYSIESYAKQAMLPTLGLDKLFKFDYIGLGLIIALVVPIIIFIILKYTTFGYELKATGFNKNASRYVGMKEKTNTIITMAISGGLAGLGAGVFYLTGVMPYYCPTSGALDMGFNGISSAFLGGLNPIGTIFSSYFLTHISQAGASLDTTYYSSQISDLISSIIIYLCAFTHMFRYLLKVGPKNINNWFKNLFTKLKFKKISENGDVLDKENLKNTETNTLEIQENVEVNNNEMQINEKVTIKKEKDNFFTKLKRLFINLWNKTKTFFINLFNKVKNLFKKKKD